MKRKPRKSIRSPKQKRSLETIKVILEATAQILNKYDSATCTTNFIAVRAGVSIGGLYQYFPNREAIFHALSISEREKDVMAMKELLVRNYDSIDQLVPILLEAALRRLSDQPRLRQVLEHDLPQSKSKQAMRGLGTELSKHLVQKLRSYADFHLPDDIEALLFVLVRGIQASFYSALEEFGPKLDRKRLVEESSDLVLLYLSRFRG